MTNFIVIASPEQFILWSRVNHSVGGELISNNTRINALLSYDPSWIILNNNILLQILQLNSVLSKEK